MNVTKAIIRATSTPGIGLENVQMVELEECWFSQGRPRSDVQMLRIDELAELAVVASALSFYIANDSFLAASSGQSVQIHASREAGDRLCPERACASLR